MKAGVLTTITPQKHDSNYFNIIVNSTSRSRLQSAYINFLQSRTSTALRAEDTTESTVSSARPWSLEVLDCKLPTRTAVH